MSPKGYTIDRNRLKTPYMAQLTLNGHHTYLGHFATAEEAHEAYLKKREENPRLPRSGGQKEGFQHPRKVCDLCEYDWAVSKFEMHRKACERRHEQKRNSPSIR